MKRKQGNFRTEDKQRIKHDPGVRTGRMRKNAVVLWMVGAFLLAGSVPEANAAAVQEEDRKPSWTITQENEPEWVAAGVWYYRESGKIRIEKTGGEPEDVTNGGEDADGDETDEEATEEEEKDGDVTNGEPEDAMNGDEMNEEDTDEEPDEKTGREEPDGEDEPNEETEKKKDGAKPNEEKTEDVTNGEETNEEPDGDEPNKNEPDGKGEIPKLENNIRISIQLADKSWEVLEQEKWKDYGIAISQEEGQKTGWITFSGEIHCSLTAGNIDSGNSNSGNSNSGNNEAGNNEAGKSAQETVSQEIVVDKTAPSIALQKIIYADDGAELVPEEDMTDDGQKIWYYTQNALKASVQGKDSAGVWSIGCKGIDKRTGETVWNEEKLWVREGADTAQEDMHSVVVSAAVPMDFQGYLVWNCTDVVGNTTKWTQPGGFCCESAALHESTSSLRMTAPDASGEFCEKTLRISLAAEDSWSGIRRITLRKNNTKVFEEWHNEGGGIKNQWEKRLTVPNEDGEQVYLAAELEDMTGRIKTVSQSWICDSSAPELSVQTEGTQKNGFFTEKSYITLRVREKWFRPELWSVTWLKKPDQDEEVEVVHWKKKGEDIYESTFSLERDGDYKLQITGSDLSGHEMKAEMNAGDISGLEYTESPGTLTLFLKMDTTFPEIRIQGVEEGGQYNGAVKLTIQTSDDYLDRGKYSCRLVGEHRGEMRLLAGGQQDTLVWEVPEGAALDDRYRLEVEAGDLSEHKSRVQTAFVINQKGSSYKLRGLEGGSILSSLPNLILEEENLSTVLHHSILCTREGESQILTRDLDYTVTEVISDGYRKRSYHLRPELFRKNGTYTIILLSEDEAGNKTSSIKNHYESLPVQLVIDRTKPVILIYKENQQSGGRENKTNGTAVSILENQKIKSVRIWKDGEELPIEINPSEYGDIFLEDEKLQSWKKLVVEVEDEAGNVWKEEITNSVSEEEGMNEKSEEGKDGEEGKNGKEEKNGKDGKEGMVWMIAMILVFVLIAAGAAFGIRGLRRFYAWL